MYLTEEKRDERGKKEEGREREERREKRGEEKVKVHIKLCYAMLC